MSRYTDAKPSARVTDLPPLPTVDWSRVGRSEPTHLPIDYPGKGAPLPEADAIVITWTSAEWSALDHVFLNSTTTRSGSDRSFEKQWYLYGRDAPKSSYDDLWGYYQLVGVEDGSGNERRVLLFKSSAHLAHPPWIDGLTDMVRHVAEDAQPSQIYSIGTAGGSDETSRLGDTVITNSGHIELEKPENTHVDYNHETFTCTGWFPNTDLLADIEKQLLFALSNVATTAELEQLVDELDESVSGSWQLSDLLNAPLNPANLQDPKGLPEKGKPLLTTDYYYIAKGTAAEQYAVLEMDDTVIAHEAGKLGIDYAFVRNISDPLVPSETPAGKAIPDDVRESWSSLIYETFGLYTSFNGALVTWATLAGEKS